MAVIKGALTAATNLAAVNNALTVRVNGTTDVGIQITGTFVATVSFEGSIDGTNWVACSVRDLTVVSDATRVTSATAPGSFIVDVTGIKHFRARCTAYTSGTAVVQMVKATR